MMLQLLLMDINIDSAQIEYDFFLVSHLDVYVFLLSNKRIWDGVLAFLKLLPKVYFFQILEDISIWSVALSITDFPIIMRIHGIIPIDLYPILLLNLMYLNC